MHIARRYFRMPLLVFFTLWLGVFAVLPSNSALSRLLAQDRRIAYAAGPYDYIVSDAEMLDTHSMDLETLRRFLLERGTLGNVWFTDIDGVQKQPYQILHRAAVTHGISPRFLLVLLQREQSLIEDRTPTQDQYDWAMGYAVCDSCAKNDPRIQKFKGFASQVESAAERLQEYLTHNIGVRPGIETLINGVSVTPANKATAALYTYTPHLHGNNNFRSIWKRYFSMRFPDGTLLKAKTSPAVYLIHYGRKRAFSSWSALTSRYDPRNILTVTTSELDQIETGPAISFPNYSLLQAPDEQRYLLVDDYIRPIDAESFRAIGYNPEELIPASFEDLNAYDIGPALTAQSAHAQDELVMTAKGGVFAVRDGVKHPIVAKEILADRYPYQTPRRATTDARGTSELDALPNGLPIGFRNGTLVKAHTHPTVYLISNGVRRAITSEQVFLSYGFEFKDVVSTTLQAVELHALGNPI